MISKNCVYRQINRCFFHFIVFYESSWKRFSQWQSTTCLQCQRLFSDRRYQKSFDSMFFAYLSTHHLWFCDYQRDDINSKKSWFFIWFCFIFICVQTVEWTNYLRTFYSEKRFALFHFRVLEIRLTEKKCEIFTEM